jgi:U3 small nucleolar RNA-associated protein 12
MVTRQVADLLDQRLPANPQFELIQKLEGHHGEIWALAVSNRGEYVVTGSHDKSIRIWEKTDEPLFLEEEREKELEEMYNNDVPDANRAEGEDEAEAVQKTTSESLMAGEKIIEAIELADAERETWKTYEEEAAKLGPEKAKALPQPTRSAELMARGDVSGEEYVWKTIRSVPAAGMEDALLVLPFRLVVSLLVYLDQWARKVSPRIPVHTIELTAEPGHRPCLAHTRVPAPHALVPTHREPDAPPAAARAAGSSQKGLGERTRDDGIQPGGAEVHEGSGGDGEQRGDLGRRGRAGEDGQEGQEQAEEGGGVGCAALVLHTHACLHLAIQVTRGL